MKQCIALERLPQGQTGGSGEQNTMKRKPDAIHRIFVLPRAFHDFETLKQAENRVEYCSSHVSLPPSSMVPYHSNNPLRSSIFSNI